MRDTGSTRLRVRRDDYRPPNYLIYETRLTIRLGEDVTDVIGELSIRQNPNAAPAARDLILDGEDLKLVSIAIDGSPLPPGRYSLSSEQLIIHDVPKQFQLQTHVRIHPEKNTALSGLYRSSGNFCTQCEAEGFRRITYYLDRPDVLSHFVTRIEASKAQNPVLLSNGNLIDQGPLADDRHYAVWDDPFPKPSYLFALVAGRLACREDSFTTKSGRHVDLRLYVEPHNIDRTSHAMRSLKKAMEWDEKRYGREYDLNVFMIVAVDDFNMGAMENKGLNIFNSKYILADQDTATDQDYASIEAVIGHEYFHNWTGDRVTLRDWFQLSLKEGLTVFREQNFSAEMSSPSLKRIQDVRFLRQFQFPEDAGPMAHPVRPNEYLEINNFYTATVYEKGAEIVRMYETLLGSSGFRKGMDLYFSRHDGQAVTCDDFRSAMADANEADLEQFGLWYSVAGTPKLSAHGTYDANRQTYRLQLTQSYPENLNKRSKISDHPLLIPLRLALFSSSGEQFEVRLQREEEGPGIAKERVLWLRAFSDEFVFEGISSSPVPSLLRGFSAPVRLDFPYSDKELAFLVAHDDDAYSRWDSAQRLIVRVITALMGGREISDSAKYLVEAFRSLLLDASVDPALVAETIYLPNESALAQEFSSIDVEALEKARRALRLHLAKTLRAEFTSAARKSEQLGSYEYMTAEVARRRIHAVSLDYLASIQQEADLQYVEHWFKDSDNMSDRLAALTILASHPGPVRERSLADFRARYHDNPLVLDKWFAIQATSRMPGALNRIKTLMSDPIFSIKNPNRVRSLIGSFAHQNHSGFHDPTGQAYQFIANQVLALDRINPQVAARLVSCFSHWKRYDSNRQTLMKFELERMAKAANLSGDVYEIVERSLA